MSAAYRAQEIPREEIAALDPFGGHGTFLPAPGEDGGAALEALGRILDAPVPAIAWNGIGVWVDERDCPVTPGKLREEWESRCP